MRRVIDYKANGVCIGNSRSSVAFEDSSSRRLQVRSRRERSVHKGTGRGSVNTEVSNGAKLYIQRASAWRDSCDKSDSDVRRIQDGGS